MTAVLLAFVLVVFVAAHLVIEVALLRRREFWRSALALVVPPLAPLWALDRGMRLVAWIWLGALAAYAIGVALF